ncbi:hypothetical protein ASG87_15620 [Frateuria sp. Soil773]|uniref:VOC family protein n=1 Tax=Frateuria sp. Soil773 TaxID=1736407 RepID=UPI0006F5BF51|nr:VOC family protein [Frateuria sp. Soil773]KRE97676.1 hypothetical protein ASG87_15620 [Frateuria sp. Soil773]
MGIDVRSVCAPLQMLDRPASIRFYEDALGFEVIQTPQREGDRFDWRLPRLGDAEIMLNAAYEAHDRPATAAAGRVSLHLDVCPHFGCADMDAAYDHLRASGIEVEPQGRSLWHEAALRRRSGRLSLVLPVARDLMVHRAGQP